MSVLVCSCQASSAGAVHITFTTANAGACESVLRCVCSTRAFITLASRAVRKKCIFHTKRAPARTGGGDDVGAHTHIYYSRRRAVSGLAFCGPVSRVMVHQLPRRSPSACNRCTREMFIFVQRDMCACNACTRNSLRAVVQTQ